MARASMNKAGNAKHSKQPLSPQPKSRFGVNSDMKGTSLQALGGTLDLRKEINGSPILLFKMPLPPSVWIDCSGPSAVQRTDG